MKKEERAREHGVKGDSEIKSEGEGVFRAKPGKGELMKKMVRRGVVWRGKRMLQEETASKCETHS